MISRRSFVPLRSAAFRFGVLLAIVFAAGCALLLIMVEQQVRHYSLEATRTTLRAESAVLAGEYGELGLSGLTDAMERHGNAGREAQFRYSLTDRTGARLFGDLPLPRLQTGYSSVLLPERERGGNGVERMTALGTPLPNGLFLVIATDTFDVDKLRHEVVQFTLISGVSITLLAMIGGYIVGSLFLRRLERVNRSVDRIIDGERAERLPAIGFGPEFDDLTRNLNRMLDRNAAAMEALRQVSTDIAHDIRTPLSRLHQHLEVMRDQEAANTSAIDDALAQSDRLLGIVQALLRIGTLEGGVGRRRFTQVDLSDVLERIYQVYQPVAEDAEHSLIAEHGSSIRVDGDAELLTQAVTNLVENAIVHTPTYTRIALRLSTMSSAVILEVCDDGPGIPLGEREKVFGRFYRLDISRHSDGAGLGLALVAAIAHLHGGTVEITDNAAGSGCCFRIALPRPR